MKQRLSFKEVEVLTRTKVLIEVKTVLKIEGVGNYLALMRLNIFSSFINCFCINSS